MRYTVACGFRMVLEKKYIHRTTRGALPVHTDKGHGDEHQGGADERELHMTRG